MEKVASRKKYEIAPHQFLQGQVLPICVGWFGDNNEDLEKASRSCHKKQLKEKI